jgi:hypothetical protein
MRYGLLIAAILVGGMPLPALARQEGYWRLDETTGIMAADSSPTLPLSGSSAGIYIETPTPEATQKALFRMGL